MIYYIILAIIIITIVLVKLVELIHVPHEKFRKYIKLVFISLIILIILSLVRFFPAIIGAIPGVILVFYRWRFLICILSKLFLNRRKKTFNTHSNMSKKEALEILGLNDGASRKEILESYNKLIKKNHPDLGGSDWIMKRLNQARDTLLG